MMSLCYGIITRLVVSGVSVTLCRPCYEVCHWPDTKPCSSLTHCRPGAIRSKILLEEINNSNQRKTHTCTVNLLTDIENRSTHCTRQTPYIHKQSFQRVADGNLDVFLFYIKENQWEHKCLCLLCVPTSVTFVPVHKCVWAALCVVATRALESPCQIISWMVRKLSADTLTESQAHPLPGGGASFGAGCCWKTSLTLLWTSLRFPPTPLCRSRT